MTTTTVTPSTNPDQTETAPCVAGLAWCNGSCAEYTRSGDPAYHGSDFTGIDGIESHEHTHPVVFDLSLTQIDGDRAAASLHLISGFYGDDFVFSPATARRLAAGLLNLADIADPLPLGITHIWAHEVRVGDEIDTPDGWQTVYMTTVDERTQFVAAFTDEKNDGDTDGWQYTFGDPLIVRRRQVARQRRREVRR